MFKIKLKNLFSEKKNYVGAKSLMEGLKMNGFSIRKQNDPKSETIYFNSGIEREVNEVKKEEFELKGGIIVFSTDVNALELSKNNLINTVLKYLKTIENRLKLTDKLIKLINHYEEVYGITIGAFTRGKYKAQNGSIFNELSVSIEIIGISTEVLDSLAKDLCEEFHQESVLVKNYQDNKIYLIYGGE